MTPPTDHTPWDQLAAFLGGTLPPDEEHRVREWIARDPSREELVASLREIWSQAADGRQSPDVEAALETIKRRRDGRPRVLPAGPRVAAFPRRANPLRWLAAAAAVLLVAGGWWTVHRSSSAPAGKGTEAVALKEYRTSRGQRVTFRLPDGTQVMLGPESRLRYARSYGDRERQVQLDGDAYFEVTHDAARPFAVLASHAVARDLGTRFVVRSRLGEAVVVAVAEGRVALGRSTGLAAPSTPLATDSLVLDVGAVGRVSPAGQVMPDRGGTLDAYLGWTEGRLVFKDLRLAAVAAELMRWYDVDIELRGAALADRRLTASFDEESVGAVLASVAASFGLRLERDGRRYILSSR